MKRLMSFGAVVFAALLAACASTGAGKPKMGEMLGNATGQNGRACVRQSDIRGYGVLKGDVISIDGARKYYLATVLPGCADLQTSVGAMFSGGFGEVCGGGMNSLATSGGDRCVIAKIYEFESREQALAVHKATLDQRKALDQSPMLD
jgi:hypothetical protein